VRASLSEIQTFITNTIKELGFKERLEPKLSLDDIEHFLSVVDFEELRIGNKEIEFSGVVFREEFIEEFYAIDINKEIIIESINWNEKVYVLNSTDGYLNAVFYSHKLENLVKILFMELYEYDELGGPSFISLVILVSSFIQSYNANLIDIKEFTKIVKLIVDYIEDKQGIHTRSLYFIGELRDFFIYYYSYRYSSHETDAHVRNFREKYYIGEFYPWVYDFRDPNERSFLLEYLPLSDS